jgi:hypothetical protein
MLRAGFLPVISVSLPLIGVMIVCASRYEVAIQEYSDGLALSSVAMVGRAVEMIYTSALISSIPYRLIQGRHEGDQPDTKESDEAGMRRSILRTKASQSRGDSDARLICKREDWVSAGMCSLTIRYRLVLCIHSQPVILQSLLVFLVHGSRHIGLFVGLGVFSHGSGSRAPKIRFRRFKAFEAARYKYNAAKLDLIRICAVKGTLRNIYGPHGSVRIWPKCGVSTDVPEVFQRTKEGRKRLSAIHRSSNASELAQDFSQIGVAMTSNLIHHNSTCCHSLYYLCSK